MQKEMVLVTGGSGFVGFRCVSQLLDEGYRVRTTVRTPEREVQVRAMLKAAGNQADDALSFAVTDLADDAGWESAASGCTYVLHVASPLPVAAPKNEDDLIVPTRQGTLRVLRAARAAGANRVVLTSSFAAIGYGHKSAGPFDEKTWTDITGPGVGAYDKAKTLAERAAWDFVAQEGGGLELSVINPGTILGPVIGADFSPSVIIIKRLLNGSVPGSPRIGFGIVDVRDLADLHLRAMKHPAAKGERFIAVSGDFITLASVARLLKEHLGVVADRVPTREIPNWAMRLMALFDPQVAFLVKELVQTKALSGDKATTMLGWTPRSREEAILATAESLIRLDLLASPRCGRK